MKKMDYQNVRGTQDYLPKAEMIRKKIRRTLEDTFEQYGCKPLETPILNYTSLMSSKYGGGASILEEMYTLNDRGKRDLALRYDLTIPFAKVVAMNPTIRLPFKRYEIGKVFRDGPIKMGRYREFTQCDVDVVGVDNQMAEAELMQMALSVFSQLNLPIIIQYNNRKLLQGLLESLGIQQYLMSNVILIIDKLEKIGILGVKEELIEKKINEESIEKVINLLKETVGKDINYFDQFATKNELISKGMEELKELTEYLTYLNINKQCIFNPFLARGLEIYTGTIYEMFLQDGSISSSIGSGGRYDNAISGLLGTDETYSTVGISFGLDVIYAAVELNNMINYSSQLDFYIIPFQFRKEALLVATQLRTMGFKVEIEMKIKKMNKALVRANKEGVKQVIFIGENEVANNKIKIKDMESGIEREEIFLFDNK
ncbi:histidine--tRNA ligase [Psychrobacillus vulpis]|uniref:Histidine--tRNA ligase n=2 Tax=Psychrobacillus vulpis TaxID=2325572 RepID=A0A544TTB1_9BACI|nr:histidine--tRNA ligase [Psychrobacillus vulpis]